MIKAKMFVKLLVPLCALSLVAAACGDDDDEPGGGAAGTESPGGGGGGESDFVAIGGWDDGPCEEGQEPIVIGMVTTVESAALNLEGERDAALAAVEAFNERGGVNGRCLEHVFCDGRADPNQEVACAREQVQNSDMVASVSNRFVANVAGAYQLYDPAQFPNFANQPGGAVEYSSPLAYEFTLGGTGSGLAGAAVLGLNDITKAAMIRIDTPQAGAIRQLIAPILTALGMELTAEIPVPATATDYSQFVIQAQNSGAEGVIMPLSQGQATQVLDAAGGLSSDLTFAVSWGTFNKTLIADISPEVSENLMFSDATPPLAASQEQFPALGVILEDFEASGEDSISVDEARATTVQSWLGVYAFVKILRDANLTEYTRTTVKQALDQATDVDMLGLMPPWTPSAKSDNQIFSAIGNTNYWVGAWDTDAEEFTVQEDQFDLIPLLAGRRS